MEYIKILYFLCILSIYTLFSLDLWNEGFYSCNSVEVFNASGKNKRWLNILKYLLTESGSLRVCISKIHWLSWKICSDTLWHIFFSWIDLLRFTFKASCSLTFKLAIFKRHKGLGGGQLFKWTTLLYPFF